MVLRFLVKMLGLVVASDDDPARGPASLDGLATIDQPVCGPTDLAVPTPVEQVAPGFGQRGARAVAELLVAMAWEFAEFHPVCFI